MKIKVGQIVNITSKQFPTWEGPATVHRVDKDGACLIPLYGSNKGVKGLFWESEFEVLVADGLVNQLETAIENYDGVGGNRALMLAIGRALVHILNEGACD